MYMFSVEIKEYHNLFPTTYMVSESLCYITPTSMATNTSASSITVFPQDSENPLTINMLNVIKLSSANYLTWSIQMKSLLKGYSLVKFIDNSVKRPSPTVIVDGTEKQNPDHDVWQRQDSLLYSALIGANETLLQPLIATSNSSLEAWNMLATTYAKPPRGHITQLTQQLK